LHARILAVFTRYYALEAYAKAIQAELTSDLDSPKAGAALRRAIEALRAAGMQASDVERLFSTAQPSYMSANMRLKTFMSESSRR
jgi:hypothetical protein